MIDAHDAKLISDLQRDEGIRRFPYRDSVGVLTVGVGRNLEDKGLSPDEIMFLLVNDIDEALAGARRFQWFDGLNDVRQRAITNMIFNLGLPRFLGFKRMIAAIERGDFDAASYEAIDSKWAHQVGPRAHRIADEIRTGGGYEMFL